MSVMLNMCKMSVILLSSKKRSIAGNDNTIDKRFIIINTQIRKL